MSWSLVWEIPTECNMSKSDGEASTVKRPWPTRGCYTTKRQIVFVVNFFSETAKLSGLLNQNQKCSYSEKQRTAPIRYLYFHKTNYSELLQLLISSTMHLKGMEKTMETTHNIGKSCVGCTERTVVVSTVHYSFVCVCCVLPVSTHYRLSLVKVLMKILVRFSKRTDCWCMFSLSICNQTDTLFLYQSSIFQCYEGIHLSQEDIISWQEQWLKTKSKWKGSPYIEEECV